MKIIVASVFTLFVCVKCNRSGLVSPADNSPGSNNNPSNQTGSMATLVCSKNDPVTELTWLKDKIASQTNRNQPGVLSPFKIVAYSYDGKTVIANESVLLSSPYQNVFNCDGIIALKSNEYNTFLTNRKEVKLLYEFKP